MFSRLLIIAITLGVLAASSFAQASSGCPSVAVYGPSGLIAPGNIARYVVQVQPIDDSRKLTYEWSVSAGVIKSGQGTSEIEVLQPNSSVTVTVKIDGLPQNCPSEASDTSGCGLTAPSAEKLVEISGALTSKNIARVKEALDSQKDRQDTQFYLIVSGTNQKNSLNRKLTALKRLFEKEPGRATYVISEKTDDKIILWAVPPGANLPTP